MNELALFAGAGGGILAGHLLGWRTVCAVERDAYAASVLVARQNDGCLPPFPIWDDVQTFDGRPWRGIVDVVSGGFPCQDVSCAGKGVGIDGERSGLWKHMARIIGEVRPRYAFVENSPMLVSRGLATVLSDFAELGYDARWGIVGAHHVGAPHKRDRIWIVANAQGAERVEHTPEREGRQDTGRGSQEKHVANAQGERCKRRVFDADQGGAQSERQTLSTTGSGLSNAGQDWWQTEPGVGRLVDGLANRVDMLRCSGNGQVPLVAATAWDVLANDCQPPAVGRR